MGVSATKLVSGGTVLASGYCPGRHDQLADSCPGGGGGHVLGGQYSF